MPVYCVPLPAGVGHFRTLAELSGPTATLLKSMTPPQLAVVVEGLGRAGANDAELFGRISDTVS